MESDVDGKRYSIEGLLKNVLNENKAESYQKYDKVIAMTIGWFLLACSCLGIALNLLALIFFKKRTTVFKSKVVFLAATCVDMLICSLCPFVVASLLSERSPLAFSQDLFCQVWGYCWSFASRYILPT